MWTPDPSAIITAGQKQAERRAAVAAAIKAEARRRIIAIMNEDRQRNTLAAGLEATMTYGADPTNWPPELQQRQAEAMAAWAEIERLRTRSDEIELMTPLPEDVTDDGLWAEQTE